MDICIMGTVSCTFLFAGGWVWAAKTRIKRCMLSMIGVLLRNAVRMLKGEPG